MNKINDNIRKEKRTPRLLNYTSTLKNTLVFERIVTYDLQNACWAIGPPGYSKTHRKRQGHLHVLLQVGSSVTYIGDAVRISNDESVLHKV